MKTQAIVNQLKENGEDFEWYPTDNKMLDIIAKDINKKYPYHRGLKILDIGAGNGNALHIIENKLDKTNTISLFAIEKSQILIEQMDKHIIVIGTDFHQQTLIDKNMDIVFCNPPYSEFSEWMIKIIKEVQAVNLYMIIPKRWKDNEEIMESLKLRKAKYKVLTSMSFEDSEYRKARVEVDIVKIELGYNQPTVDAFDLWFDKHFQFSAQRVSESDYDFETRKKKEINELVTGKNVIERMVELYNSDMQELMNNYKKVGELDASLLKELGVNIASLKKALEEKIRGLKNIYWKLIFDRLEDITSRLTVDSRKSMTERLMGTTSIDFTESNVYAILIWVIKHANTYYDKQLVDIYYQLSRTENVKNYKSNKKFINDTWRYARNKTHYKFDYRIVYDGFSAFEIDYRDNIKKLKNDKLNLISDIFTVANNLGFRQIENPSYRKWHPGGLQTFTYVDLMTNKLDEFCDIRVYKNGNIHFKFNQKFMRKFNVEAARLNGWVKSPQEASEELEIPMDEVEKVYGINCQFRLKDMKLLT